MKTTISLGREIKMFFFLLFCIFNGNVNSMFSQDFKSYFLEIKEGYELGSINKTVNPDQTILLNMANTEFATFLNNKIVYDFKEAFPALERPRLKRVYILTLPFESTIGDISNRPEVENIELYLDDAVLAEDSIPAFGIIPNDYFDFFISNRNQELDLINAPLAWNITTGENVLVGVCDSKISYHEDLIGQVIQELPGTPYIFPHGTGTAGKIAAKTNNNIGVSSLAFNSKIVSTPSFGHTYVLQLAQVPGVKVINCSWIACNYSQYWEEMYLAIEEEYGVLVVAAAGNGPDSGHCGADGHGYAYPASFENTISVTSVGSKFPIGYHHHLINPSNGQQYWSRSWKDCHGFNPHLGDWSHTHNDKVDVCAPGILTTSITDNPIYPTPYALGTGTSGATPYVSALAALVFSINPNFTPSQVKEIITNTADDIYYIPYNQQYLGKLGTGRINAYRAVKTAWCMDNPGSEGLDLAMQNSLVDYFEEPDTNTDVFWFSEDIWTRNQDDGILIKEHQNPEYDPNNPSYAYVRVTNSSCAVNSGNEELKLYWSKANASLTWPSHWNGSFYVTDPITGQNILMGDEIGTITIPPLSPGESIVLTFEWQVPNPEDYININPNPWHFCLLARIDTPNDPMTVAETGILSHNILKNNNIVLKNTTVVDIITDSPTPIPVVATVMIGNSTTQQKSYELQFKPAPNEPGSPIYEEAEVTLTLDDILYNVWENAGKTMLQAEEIKPRVIKLNDSTSSISNITLNPGEMGTVNMSFNFLTKNLTAKERFIYHLMQKDLATGEIVGGETFEIKKQMSTTFIADAGNDEAVNKNESVTISASDIGQNAIYNWYDPQGNLIYTGIDLTITPQITQTYKLEVITTLEGFKDYDEVTVSVNPYHIDTLIPNPASSQVTINFEIGGSSSAYLMFINTQTGSSDNYILDISSLNTSIDISSYPTGLYTVVLVCDGEIQNSKSLIKQ